MVTGVSKPVCCHRRGYDRGYGGGGYDRGYGGGYGGYDRSG
jgi:hypothetical protein